MIPYRLPEEKAFILRYARLLQDDLSEEIIVRDSLQSKTEAIHLAEFFWNMVERSNAEDKKNGNNSERMLEKIIVTFMAYFRSAGFESEWEEVSDRH